MKQETDLDSNVHNQGSMTPSAGNNFSPMFQHDHSPSPSLSHRIKRKYSRLNEADESYSTVSEDSLRQLQKECEKKNDQLKVYSDYIDMLKSNCDEKDALINQLKSEASLKDGTSIAFNEQSDPNVINALQEECNSKEAHLVEMKNAVKQLMKEIVKKDAQLKANADTICEFQAQSDDKNAQLGKMESKIKQLETVIVMQDRQLRKNRSEINKLQTSCAEKDAQLKKKECTIGDFRTRCNNMEIQLVENANLIGQFRSKRIENEAEVQVIPENLAYLEDKVNSHFDALFDLAEKCREQKQYVKANVHYKDAIKFEKSTQNRPYKLAMLFVSQSFCYGELESYQQVIDAATSAFYYDSNCKEALYNRAFAYFNLKQYFNAGQDLQKFLQLDSSGAEAKTLLDKVQSCLNEAN